MTISILIDYLRGNLADSNQPLKFILYLATMP